ncbi:hypothetical protein [Bradyrhizobium sp. USDA 4353]
MSQLAEVLPPISYPALLWRQGYTYLAGTPLELCAHPRSIFQDTLLQTRNGDWYLLDAQGRSFDIANWVRVRPFGGLRGIGLRLLGSIFAAPVLTNEKVLSLTDYKRRVVDAIESRYRYDLDKEPAIQAISRIRAASSYKEAIDALPKL